MLLKLVGHKAECASSGQDALDYLQKTVPDLIVLDVMMPGMDGPEVLRAVRQRPQTKGVPVVMYSALSDPGLRADLLALGASDYWVKASVDPETVERRIAELVPASASR
jgi:CheY-like chemotaxis protein